MRVRDLHLTSPLMHGEDVEVLQRKLAALGFHPGAIDGRYGSTTAAAVRAFQRKHNLRADGIVGKATRSALAAVHVPPTPPVPKPAPKGLRALTEARKWIGVREDPPGSNRQRFGAWFGVNGVQWCAIFMSYCWDVAAGVVLCKGSKAIGVYPKGTTYVPTLKAWLISSGHWVGRTTPRAGDIAIFNWDGGPPDHVGIVESYLGGGKFQTIEGNTAIGNDSNGGEVMRRIRYISQVDGFGRIQ